MWAWILQLGKLWSLVQVLLGAVSSFFDWLARRDIEKIEQEIVDAAKAYKQANQIKEPKERVNAKLVALQKLEKLAKHKSDSNS